MFLKSFLEHETYFFQQVLSFCRGEVLPETYTLSDITSTLSCKLVSIKVSRKFHIFYSAGRVCNCISSGYYPSQFFVIRFLTACSHHLKRLQSTDSSIRQLTHNADLTLCRLSLQLTAHAAHIYPPTIQLSWL